jgi:hypothetical protein
MCRCVRWIWASSNKWPAARPFFAHGPISEAYFFHYNGSFVNRLLTFTSKPVNVRALPYQKKTSFVSCMYSLLRRCRLELWHTFTESAVRSLNLSQVNCQSLKRGYAIAVGGANCRTQNNHVLWQKTATAGTSERLVGPTVDNHQSIRVRREAH